MSNKNIATKTAPESAPIDPVAVAKEMKAQNKSTSDIIRALSKICINPSDGAVNRGAIVKALKDASITTKNGTAVLYQHVRNTLITPVKKAT